MKGRPHTPAEFLALPHLHTTAVLGRNKQPATDYQTHGELIGELVMRNGGSWQLGLMENKFSGPFGMTPGDSLMLEMYAHIMEGIRIGSGIDPRLALESVIMAAAERWKAEGKLKAYEKEITDATDEQTDSSSDTERSEAATSQH